MTNVRNLALPQWRRLAERPENRCLVPLKGEMWFAVPSQPVFAVAGLWQRTREGRGFTMVTCDPNELVRRIHPKAMITILAAEDVNTWLRGSYEEVTALQRPYDAERMTVRGPVFPTRRSEA
jgi:putative SOS response-associated peptidase YedK